MHKGYKMIKKLCLILSLLSFNVLNSFEKIPKNVLKNCILPFLIQIDDSSPENLVNSLRKLISENASKDWKNFLIDRIKYEIKIRKINVNVSDNNKSSLHIAARNGYVTIAQLLIDCGADVNEKIASNDLRINIQDVSTDKNSIFASIREEIEYQMALPENSDIHKPYLEFEVENWSPLHEAIFYNNFEVARILIESKANVEAVATVYPSSAYMPLFSGFPVCLLTPIRLAKFLLKNNDHFMKLFDENEPLTQELENDVVEPPLKKQKRE